jgi:hypothetical protein
MPVDKLFVEGNLELQLLAPICEGFPLLQQGGSKNSLKPRTCAERRDNKIAAGYLRDRDFDFDPPKSSTEEPVVDHREEEIPVGWRWRRHEMENYLMEPLLVSEATGWNLSEFEDALRQVAVKIYVYEAARWTIGVVRRSLPPHYELQTRPDNLNEIDLPEKLDFSIFEDWACKAVRSHGERIARATDSLRAREQFENFTHLFQTFVDLSDVLLWFSGKDILAGLSPWLSAKKIANAGAFRALLRDWVIKNPQRTIELLPEWNALLNAIRT